MHRSTSWTRAFFETHPVFRTGEFIDASPASEQSARDLLKYYRRNGLLTSVRTGIWHVAGPHGVPVDPIAVAGRVAPDAIVALNAAMTVHGLGYSAFSEAVVYSASRIAPFAVSGTRIRSVPHPRELVSAELRMLQTVELHRSGSSIRVATRERALVDMLDRQDLSGGIEEVWRTARQLGWIEDRNLLPYLAARARPTLAARVGFLLEHEPQIAVAADLVEQLHQLVIEGGRGPWQLAPGVDGPQQWNARWRLLVPHAALPSHWDEPTEW